MKRLIIKPKYISFSGSLRRLPKEILECRDILKIIVKNNDLKEVPKDIENLTRIETFDVSNNKLNQVFSNLFKLKKLKILNLSNNNIINLPKQISNLENLKILHISNNNLKSIPDEIGELSKLEELNLSYNKLHVFPESLFKLKKLKTLWIGGNYFKQISFPQLMKEFPELKRLYLYSNIEYNRFAEVDDLYKTYSSQKGNILEIIKEDTQKSGCNNLSSKKMENILFISYSHADKKWLDRVNTHLKVLQLEGFKISPWSDQSINVGDKWKLAIQQALDEAKAAILIISTDFLVSPFILNNELPPLLEAASNKGLKIYCVIVGHCLFDTHVKLSEYQALNDPKKPLCSLSKAKVDKILVDLMRIIKKDFE
jgi:hypothetical protein